MGETETSPSWWKQIKFRRILILLSDGAAQLFNLHLAGFGGDFPFRKVLPPVAIHCVEKPHSKGTGGAQPGSPGDIGSRGDFHSLEFHLVQNAVKNAVPDLGKVGHQLALGILQHSALLVEVGMDGDIAISVDRCA